MRRELLWIGLSVALVLALGVRLYGIDREDFWLDEIHSMSNSAGLRAEFESVPHGVILEPRPSYTQLPSTVSVVEVWRGMQADSHPPVYFVLLMFWRELFGDGEVACRILPIAFSVLSILPVALIFRDCQRPREALLAAFLLALSMGHVHMGQQSRPYSLGLLLVALSYWILVRLDTRWKDGSPRARIAWLAMYGLTIYAAAMTHYFTCLAMLGQVVFVWTRLRGRCMRAWSVTVAVSVVAFFVTWGPQLLGQLDFISSHVWILEETPDHWLRTILRAADLPIRLLFAHTEFQVSYLHSLAGLILVVFSTMALWRRRDTCAVVFLAWYFVPLASFVVIDLTTSRQTLSHVRYVCVVVPGLAGLIAAALFTLRPVAWRTAGICIALAMALTLRLPALSHPHSRQAARLIGERLQPGSLLVFDAIDWPPYWVGQIYHNVAY